MVKRLLLNTLLIALLLPINTLAHDFEVNGIYYNINSGEKVSVTFQGSSYSQFNNEYVGDVTIPSTVTYNGITYTVSTIGNDAFHGCNGLTSIDIPNSVVYIGSYAFYGCSSLETLYFNAENCRSFSQGTTNPFYNSNISTIIIGDNVQTIPDFFLYGLNTLTNVIFGNSVTSIGKYSFRNCKGLSSIIIPNTVFSIGDFAFEDCSSLSTIVVPNSVFSIGLDAFSRTAWYTNQPDGLVYAGLVAYKYKGAMPAETNIIFKDNTLGIADKAFTGCTGLVSVTIPESVSYIGQNAFSGCTALTELNFKAVSCVDFNLYQHPFDNTNISVISIGNNVQKIPAYFAYGFSQLTSINIPESVTYVGDNAFSKCSGLVNIKVSSGNAIYDSRNNCNCIIETASSTLIVGCNNSVVPNSVTSIGNSAFNGCSELTNVSIPNSVTSIGNGAFIGCSKLTSITIPNSIVSIGDHAFIGCSSLEILNFNAENCTDFTQQHPFDNTNILTIIIGNNVQKIPAFFAFNFSKLTKISIPISVTSIGSYAFYGCEVLNEVYSDITDPSLLSMGDNVFSLGHINYSSRILHVPTGYIEAYQTDNNWRPYFGAIVDSDTLPTHPDSFEIDGIKYTITSDSTVKVSGQSFWNLNGTDNYESSFSLDVIDIIIPNQVAYNNKDYIVTEIADWAFYCVAIGNEGNYTNILIDFNITIPESVVSIGKAFGGNFGMINVFCQREVPPMMNGVVDEYNGIINLFVSSDAYSSYQSINNQNHYFDSIYISDGERSNHPNYIEEFLYQPISYNYLPYGCAVKIFPKENSVVYMREIYNYTGLYDHINTWGWERCDNRDSVYFYYESYNDGGAKPDGWAVEFFAIEEGKSPSNSIMCGYISSDYYEGFGYKWWETFDFQNNGISYNLIANSAEVTFRGYIDSGYGEKSSRNDKGSAKIENSERSHYYQYSDVDQFDYYSGDIVIPSTATYHNYANDSYTNYPVVSIFDYAFKDCVNLNSITIPSSITTIHEGAFERCDGLTRVNITDLEAWCKIIFLEYGNRSTNPLACAHHLYLNGSEVTDLIIPNSVTTINWCAFEGCSGLTSVTIPSTVTDIGLYSFWNCPNLTFIRCLGKIPPTPDECDDIFFDESVYQNATLYVPFDFVEAYRNAPVWCKFQNIVGFYDYDFETDGLYFKVTNEGEVSLTTGPQPYSGSVMVTTAHLPTLN